MVSREEREEVGFIKRAEVVIGEVTQKMDRGGGLSDEKLVDNCLAIVKGTDGAKE